MGRILILNGSPRAPKSNSKRYAQLFLDCRRGDYLEITRSNHQQLCAQVGAYSDLVLAFPLYADGLPVTLLHFLKALEAHLPAHKPTVSVLINCGFLEYGQNDIAVEMVALFCRQNGFPFGSVLKIGSGEAILDTPFRFLAAGAIRRLAAAGYRPSGGSYEYCVLDSMSSDTPEEYVTEIQIPVKKIVQPP